MKLYTETEILSLLKIHLADEEQADSFVALLTPIELPSDEEIDKQAEHEDTYSEKWLLQEAQNGCGTEHLDATMSNNKKSSIMWLYEKMFVNHGRITIEEFEQAKAMHKEEMIDFGNDLLAQNDINYIGMPNLAEQYYNETFGGEK